jgi:hypothetical protein
VSRGHRECAQCGKCPSSYAPVGTNAIPQFTGSRTEGPAHLRKRPLIGAAFPPRAESPWSKRDHGNPSSWAAQV